MLNMYSSPSLKHKLKRPILLVRYDFSNFSLYERRRRESVVYCSLARLACLRRGCVLPRTAVRVWWGDWSLRLLYFDIWLALHRCYTRPAFAFKIINAGKF